MTPAERLRQHQRSLTKAQRELDRERARLEQSEKKLVIDIKKSAKAGQFVRSDLYHRYLFQQLPECLQSDGKGSRSNTPLHSQVLPNAHTTPGRQPTNTNP